MSQRTVVGIEPWLPWPFSAWSWWTEPVRAERLAALRIGLALCLLVDIAVDLAPNCIAYFGKNELGGTALFGWRFDSPRPYWSLLRGFDDPVAIYLSLATFVACTLWI